jgi:hypothetical protein
VSDANQIRAGSELAGARGSPGFVVLLLSLRVKWWRAVREVKLMAGRCLRAR